MADYIREIKELPTNNSNKKRFLLSRGGSHRNSSSRVSPTSGRVVKSKSLSNLSMKNDTDQVGEEDLFICSGVIAVWEMSFSLSGFPVQVQPESNEILPELFATGRGQDHPGLVLQAWSW